MTYINGDPIWENARFLLRVTQEQSLTYDGTEKFCDSVQDFTDILYEKMAHQMKQKLTDLRGSTIDDSITQDLLSVCKPIDLFTGLKTRYSREQYYETHFNYQVVASYVANHYNDTCTHMAILASFYICNYT